MTRWKSDCCKCDIEYSDDGNFTIIKVNNQCVRHVGLNGANHFNAILSDCKTALTNSGVIANGSSLTPIQISQIKAQQQTLYNSS